LMIERFYADLLGDGLAPKTVSNTHTVLRKALSDADRLGLIARNPAASARPPSVPRHESEVWTAEQLGGDANAARDRIPWAFIDVCPSSGALSTDCVTC
jgi:hypothetical protein